MGTPDLTDAVAFRHCSAEAQRTFIVSWTFFNVCNYDCSYCAPHFKDGTLRGHRFAEIKPFLEKLLQSFPQKKFLFEFTGGEVTLYQDFTLLLDFLHAAGCDVSIISNGSRSLAWWEVHAKKIAHACLTFHPDRADLGHFKQLIATVKPFSTVHVNIMVPPGRVDEGVKTKEQLRDQHPEISVALQPLGTSEEVGHILKYGPKEFFLIMNQHANDELSKPLFGMGYLYSRPHATYRGQMAWVSANGATRSVHPGEVVKLGQNCWKGWECAAGLEMLMIDSSGDVFRGYCKTGGKIGHVTQADIRFPTSTVTCDKPSCPQAIDVMSTKARPLAAEA